MNDDFVKRLHDAEQAMHSIWLAHCAGAECKSAHKLIWNEIQQCLIEAAKRLERWGES